MGSDDDIVSNIEILDEIQTEIIDEAVCLSEVETEIIEMKGLEKEMKDFED